MGKYGRCGGGVGRRDACLRRLPSRHDRTRLSAQRVKSTSPAFEMGHPGRAFKAVTYDAAAPRIVGDLVVNLGQNNCRC